MLTRSAGIGDRNVHNFKGSGPVALMTWAFGYLACLEKTRWDRSDSNTASETGGHGSQAPLELVNPPYIGGPLRRTDASDAFLMCFFSFFSRILTDDGFDRFPVHAFKRLLHHLSQQRARTAVGPDGVGVIAPVVEEDGVLGFVEGFFQ